MFQQRSIAQFTYLQSLTNQDIRITVDITHRNRHRLSFVCHINNGERIKSICLSCQQAVKLESAHAGRTRYLVVVCHSDEAALLGIDCNENTTVGLALRVLADTSIKLDGDGYDILFLQLSFKSSHLQRNECQT